MSTYVNMPDGPVSVASTGILGVISDAIVNAVANYQITDVDNSNAINKV
jgi:hypothetical protein